jgi:hypothetical protein
VVLAIGRRGSPRPLGVPGDDAAKVAYRLVEPEQYHDRRVLVVGGGDSALEAAIMLADESSAEVSIAYRRPEFARCRPLNRQKIAAHIERQRVRPLMSTEIVSLDATGVTVKTDGGPPAALANDYVIACLGGELPTEFLKAAGVGIHRHKGDRAMPNPALARQAPAGRPLAQRFAAWKLALVGVGVMAVLVAVGRGYYWLPQAARFSAPHHAWLKPSGLWGHGVGILATMFMLSNFVYSLRKRVPFFKGKGPVGPWLRLHVFVGLMSPLTILFHSAFQWSNHLATTTYLSLVMVVLTGIVGRYIYGLVKLAPASAGPGAATAAGMPELHRAKQLMNVWRIIHVTLSIVLLALIVVHVWISVRVGFRWMWS